MAGIGQWLSSKIDYPVLKTHYFLFNGALAGAVPFLPIYAKDLGISAVTVGIIYAVLPFLSMIAKPLFGAIADRTRKIDQILYILLCLISFASLILVLIPSKEHEIKSNIICSSSGTKLIVKNNPDVKCVNNLPKTQPFLCDLSCHECSNFENASSSSNESLNLQCQKDLMSIIHSKISYDTKNNSEFNVFLVVELEHDSRYMNTVCEQNLYFSCEAVCNYMVEQCYERESSKPEYQRMEFWMFVISVVLIYVIMGVTVSLTDAACFNILGSHANLYGKQRLWGTIGWGLFAAIAGILNYFLSKIALYLNYRLGFGLVTLLLIIDLFTVKSLYMEQIKISHSILKDIGRLLKKLEILAFIISVFVIGALTGVFWSYLFWHLLSLNATQLLLGLASAVQCFIGELPFFYFSGYILAKIGHYNTLTVVFIIFGIRFILYSYLENPWWVLPIEILQGPTYGLFYAAMATYASVAALPGTEATMQGLVGGAFEGLGVAVGSLLGGLGMQTYKGSWTFFWAGVISLVYCIIHIIFSVVLVLKRKKDTSHSEPVEVNVPESERASFI